VSGINGFVIDELVVADISKIESGKVRALMGKCAVVPVLGIPVLGCTIDGLCRDGSVDVFVPVIFVKQSFDRLVALKRSLWIPVHHQRNLYAGLEGPGDYPNDIVRTVRNRPI